MVVVPGVSLRAKVEPSNTAKVVTAVLFGATAFLAVRRLPRPLRPVAELALAGASPWIASYLTQLGV
jgi:hypothetical protein